MRIGVDCHPFQSGSSRGRGIARYASDLLRNLIGAGAVWDFVLYVREDLPTDQIPGGPNVVRHDYRDDRSSGATAIQEAVKDNPHRLDLLLVLSPRESFIEVGPGLPRAAAVVYDLIPERFPEVYLANDSYRRSYDRYLAAIQDYDLLLAISAWTRRDFIERRGLPADRVVALPAAVDHARFRPAASTAILPAPLAAMGVEPPFVLHVGGRDARKGGAELIEAFGLIPRPIREAHQLVYAYGQPEARRAELSRLAVRHDVRLLTTGPISEPDLIALYQHCALFAFPSKAEGLGLPVLEAMACGAPVVTGDNSALSEAVGDAGHLVDASDPRSIMRAIEHLLTDPRHRALLSHAGRRRALSFTWEQTAHVAREALCRAADPLPQARRIGRSGSG
jgi:glycosyltransferase involved in cell wall biosynthesis